MEVLTRLLPKLAELLVGEYNLQREVKGGIKFLQAELEHMKAALEKISSTPADQLDKQDKIWARDVREMSYDIEDKVDTFMVRCKGSKLGKQHGFKKVIDRSLVLLMQPKIRHKIATDIRDIKSRVKEVAERRDRYKIDGVTANPAATIDPRLLGQYKMATELVGVDDARDELIRILIEGDDVAMQQGKVISIVGFGGLGKTTLARAVYEKISAQFECRAFFSVSQAPDMRKLLKHILSNLTGKKINDETLHEGRLISELRKFLQEKRYFIVVDDIWDISVWETIRCALPHNNTGYQIIATTRNVKVAEHAGGAYNMKPLSPHNSRRLLNNRIYGNNDAEKSPDVELAEVTDRIIRKCAGVPLAIITIGSLLARKGRNKIEWYDVCNSIGTGMENSLDVENMRKILSYSYYDMPPHLRTCLLYLSVLPEDYEIGKDRLIRLWIAEGFIQYEDKRKRLFEIGESYFNELINRSMIQPAVYIQFGIHIISCRLHDMLLDLVRSLSSQENFVTILSDMENRSGFSKVRRLSLQNSEADHASTWGTRGMPQVRSLVVFSYAINQIPALQSFKVLRVLDLEDCDLSEGYSLKYLGSLFNLRYLNLSHTRIHRLPKEVENLQFLETLDIRHNYITHLQLNIAQFKHLLCLLVDQETRVSNGIWSLKCLEEVSWLRMDDESMDHIEELGLLTELRVLHMSLHTDKWNNKMVESLSKLRKIQTLCIISVGDQRNIGGLDAWVASGHFRRLYTQDGCWFSRLPAWMNNPSHLADLCELYIAVRELQEKDLNVLGRLPALTYLELLVDHESLGIRERFVVGAGSFPCLVSCDLMGFVVPVVFQQGAMPRGTELDFDFHVPEVREIAGSDSGFDLGLQNLPSLQTVYVHFRSGGASEEEVEEAKAAVRKAAEIHPNKPKLVIF